MEQDKQDELEALDALVHSGGWAHVLAYLERNWGPTAYRQRCLAEIKRTSTLPSEMEVQAQLSILQVEAVTQAMELLRAWPSDRVKQLHALSQKGETKRRGSWRQRSDRPATGS
jgi:hypothetical protein